MRGINQQILMGNVGRDLELKYTAGGMAIGTFSVATSHSRKKGGSDEYENVTTWHNVKILGKFAETASKSNLAVKGNVVYVSGRTEHEQWEKDGVKHNRTTVICDELQVCKFADRDGDRQPSSKSGGGSDGWSDGGASTAW